jgi:hypothetical protein
MVLDISKMVEAIDLGAGFRRQAAETASRISTILAGWDEAYGELLGYLGPRGWVLSPTMDGVNVYLLLRIAREHGAEAAEEHLLAAYTPEACATVLASCAEHPAFAPWQEHIQQASAAHGRGEFILSTPVWLIVLEGVVKEQLALDRIFSALKKRTNRVRMREHLPVAGSQTLRDGFVDALHHVGESLPSAPAGGELRRHTTLHGVDPGYGTPANSLRGIVLLEALHYLLVQGAEAQAAA